MKQASFRSLVVDFLMLTAGSALVALGLVLFTVPNDIAPGGVSGLATALSSITPVAVGTWTLLLNLPVLVIAWFFLGFRPLLKTLYATLLLSVLIDLFTLWVPPYCNNILLAAVLGGVIMGVGLALVFLRGASTGGTDLISLMLHRAFPNLSIGMLLLMVDAAVVIFAVCVFGELEVALYSIVTIFATTKTIDAIQQGIDHAKVFYVVTERGDAICQSLAGDMGMGVTVLPAEGAYTRRSKQVLMLVVRRNAYAQTLAAIKAADPQAFLFVSNAVEVFGEGFKQ